MENKSGDIFRGTKSTELINVQGVVGNFRLLFPGDDSNFLPDNVPTWLFVRFQWGFPLQTIQQHCKVEVCIFVLFYQLLKPVIYKIYLCKLTGYQYLAVVVESAPKMYQIHSFQ